jgi:perosamine synthetase
VYRPDLSGNESRYVQSCLDSSWISSVGPFIDRFECAFAAATGAAHAISVTNGTVALHVALHCLDVGPGDEVIVPTFTYVSSVNTIRMTGATPVFADSRPGDWLLDPADVERRITPRTRAIMAVHLYGGACDMAALRDVAQRHGLLIVEDCAEGVGTRIDGRHVGTLGDIGTFSFYGNKTITTGEGGMVITADAALARKLRSAKSQGQSAHRRYWHDSFGFNYRMTNIAAAIGLAQIERLDDIRARKQKLSQTYKTLLAEWPVTFQTRASGVESCDWLVTLLLPPIVDRDRLMDDMQSAAVETRPVFYCAHTMPIYATGEHLPVAESIASRGLSLPSYPQLSQRDLERVCDVLIASLRRQGIGAACANGAPAHNANMPAAGAANSVSFGSFR